MSFLIELLEFMRVRKKYWLAPIVLVLLVFGGLIILVQGPPSRRSSTRCSRAGAACVFSASPPSITIARRPSSTTANRGRGAGGALHAQEAGRRFPYHAIHYCLARRIDLDDVDHVVFYEKPFMKFERLLETYLAIAPRGFKSFRMAIPVWIKEKLFQKI